MTTENTDQTIEQPAAAPAPAAPAPVAPPAPADIPAAPAPAPAPEVKPFEETGDPALDVAFSFLNSVGISDGDPDVEAARTGDFSKIEEKLKTLGDKAKGYEKHLALAKGVYEREAAAAKAKHDAILQTVHAAAGGETRWAAIREWAGKEATDEQKAAVNAALGQGGLVAQATVEKLAKLYDKANPTSKLPASAVKDGAAQSTGEAAPMTAKEYAKAVDALARKMNGRDISNLPEYKALRAARTAARNAGVK